MKQNLSTSPSLWFFGTHGQIYISLFLFLFLDFSALSDDLAAAARAGDGEGVPGAEVGAPRRRPCSAAALWVKKMARPPNKNQTTTGWSWFGLFFPYFWNPSIGIFGGHFFECHFEVDGLKMGSTCSELGF